MAETGQRKIETLEKAYGGAGFVTLEHLLTPEQMGAHCNMFSKVTIKPNCELGHHDHFGETETYYILSGRGMYEDEGKEIPVEAGDVTFCQDGKGHGIKNSGTEDLVFMALILKK